VDHHLKAGQREQFRDFFAGPVNDQDGLDLLENIFWIHGRAPLIRDHTEARL
jgi:hypothetical protein